MNITALRTRLVRPSADTLEHILAHSLPKKLKEKTIIAITSKVVSLCEGRIVRIPPEEKDSLIMREADSYLPRKFVPGGWVMHTLKNGLLIPTAGIDESNSDGTFVLWPKDPTRSARRIRRWVRRKYRLKNVGVLITDSHSIPLRRGTVGISLACAGFEPLRDYRGMPDLFGRAMKVTIANVADSLATAAVFAMGEGTERTPVALITGAMGVQFCDTPRRSRKAYSSFEIPVEEDLYAPFIKAVPWRRGGNQSKPRGRSK